MRPAEPTSSGSAAPSGTIVRRPWGDSSASTHTPAIAVAHVQLRALAGRVAECFERGPGDLGQPQAVRGRAAECDEAEPEREATVCVAADEAVRLERGGEAVRRRPRQSRDGHELGERAGLLLERAEHGHRLVEHPDAAYAAVHKPRF